MSGFFPDDDLMSWIAELRARVDCRHTEMLPPIDLGHGTHALRATYALRIMLADLDRFEAMGPDDADDPANVARRTNLLADFRAVRLLLD